MQYIILYSQTEPSVTYDERRMFRSSSSSDTRAMGINVDTKTNTNDYASNSISNGHWKVKTQKILPDIGLKVKRRRKRSDDTSTKKDEPQSIKGFKKGNIIFRY